VSLDTQTNDRNERVLSWAREHGEFRGKQAADMLGVKVQGIGPVLSSMVRNGELTLRVHGSQRFYSATEEQEAEAPPIDPDALQRPDFEITLVNDLVEQSKALSEEHDQIVARQAELVDQKARIDAALEHLRDLD
jgi:predicted ArsR family transcriptional regulator